MNHWLWVIPATITIVLIITSIYSKNEKTKSVSPPDKTGEQNNPHGDKHEEQPRKLWLENMRFIIAAIVIFIVAFFLFSVLQSIFSKDTPKPETTGNIQNVIVKFPTSGTGIANKNNPVHAHLDPLSSSIQVLGEGHTEFVLATNNQIFWFCSDKKPKNSTAQTGNIENWYHMPAGDYLIYPNGSEEIMVSWHN